MIGGAGSRQFPARVVGLAAPGIDAIKRQIAVEAPIALEYSGIGYAVMMATPTDLEDFVIGHALGEGLVGSPDEIGTVDISETAGGWIGRAQLSPEATTAIHARARTRISDSSCGLCGVESIGEALRPLPPVAARISVSAKAIGAALAALPDHQKLNGETGAAHAAAFCTSDGRVICAREDVGRHNALDKLIGAMVRLRKPMREGFVLLSARASFELVEKTVRAGAPMLATISAPTSLATERACAAGLTLIALARSDSMLILNDPHDSIETGGDG